MKGIDVSYANDSINWSKVKSSGVEFAIIRSSFGSDLPSQIDNQYYQNASGYSNSKTRSRFCYKTCQGIQGVC